MRASLWIRMALGLAALVGGLQIASRALRGTASARTRRWLGHATGHPLGGVATGLVATVLVHSSSLSTIATVGLVDARVLTLDQAAGVIVGANVGTTLATHILAWRPGPLPAYGLLALGGLLALRRGRLGRVVLGGGLLLLGLVWIDASAAALGGQPWFPAAMVALAANPWLGVGVGVALTTLVLSSTLTVGILQGIAAQGMIPLGAALPILFGSNVGTTTDTLLASLGAGRDAQRAAVFHLLFNVVGTLLFLSLTGPLAATVGALSADPARQIAFAHTLFNLGTAAVVLPLRRWLIGATRLLLPD